MMQGRRHCRPLHGKARAMACGGNPRALPDFSTAVNEWGQYIPYLWQSIIRIAITKKLNHFGNPYSKPSALLQP